MSDLTFIARLLCRRCFVEASYFAVVNAMKMSTAEAHMLAGVGCCGCAAPLAAAQRLLEFIPVADEDMETGSPDLIVSPATELPYEGFFHLVEAFRLDPAIAAPKELREIFDAVADDLAYVSRREIHRPPDRQRRYSHRMACASAAVLLRRLTNNGRKLPGIEPPTLDAAGEIIQAELAQRGGDAAFFPG